MTNPIDEHLFGLIREAFDVGLTYIRAYREEGGYIGRHREWPELSWGENGMPWLTEAFEGPPDYGTLLQAPLSLYDLKVKNDFKDEPCFKSLLKYMRSHDRIKKHFVSSMGGFLEISVVILLGDILDRYIHQFNSFEYSKEHLLQLYLPLEVFLLEEQLNIGIAVPILSLKFEDVKVVVDDNITIGRMSDAIQLARNPIRAYYDAADPRVQSAATHAIVLDNYVIPNESEITLQHILRSADSFPLEVVDRFFAALRLAVSHPTGYGQVLVLPLGWASSYKGALTPLHKISVRRYPESFENGIWLEDIPQVSSAELQSAVMLFKRICEVNDQRLNIALRRLNLSSLRVNGEDGLLDAMIGIEALLSDGNQEMTYKVSIRMAALCKLSNQNDPVLVMRELKKIYALRSKIVHGKPYDIDAILRNQPSGLRIIDAALDYLKTALRLLLEHPEFLEVNRIDQELMLQA